MCFHTARVPTVAGRQSLADQESLRQAIRAGLDGVLEVQPPLAIAAKQLLKARRILQRANDEFRACPPV